MIILTQNEKELINFNNIEHIWIEEDKDDKRFEICADGETLGFYDTEERAEEVLFNLAYNHSAFEVFKVIPKRHQNRMAGMFARNDILFDLYEMPLE